MTEQDLKDFAADGADDETEEVVPEFSESDKEMKAKAQAEAEAKIREFEIAARLKVQMK